MTDNLHEAEKWHYVLALFEVGMVAGVVKFPWEDFCRDPDCSSIEADDGWAVSLWYAGKAVICRHNVYHPKGCCATAPR